MYDVIVIGGGPGGSVCAREIAKVYLSRECNDIRATLGAMVHLMKINPLKYVTLTSLNPIKALIIIVQAKLNRSHGRQVNPACSLFKLR